MHQVDPESLRCFVAVSAHLSFRAAANSVHLSPAALGQRIAKLEEHLRVRLFERTTRKVQLTPAAARLLPAAKSILEQLDALPSLARSEDAPSAFELTIGTRFELGLSWLVPNLSHLRRNRPERTIHLSFGDSDDMLTRVEQGLVDAAVTSSPTLPSGARFESLHSEEYCYVSAPSRKDSSANDFAQTGRVLIDLSPDLPLFRYRGGQGPAVEEQFERVEYLGTIAAVLSRVIEGIGVAVLPHYYIAKDLAAGKLIEIPTAKPLQSDAFRLLWHAGHPFEAELRKLAAELRAIPLN